METRNSKFNNKFDPFEHLERLLAPTGLSIKDTGGEINIEGEDPLFASAVRLWYSFFVAAIAAAAGAAAIWRKRTGEGQKLSIDIRKAAHGINPELTFHHSISYSQNRRK